MNRLLMTTALLLAFGAPAAYAQTASDCVAVGEQTVCDPTSFHVSAPGATGSDPVLLNNTNTFTITEVGNKNISSPVRVLIIEPDGPNADSISGATGQFAALKTALNPLGTFNIGATGINSLGSFDFVNDTFDGPAVTLSAGQDLVKQIGFNGGAASISFTNIIAEYTALGLTLPSKFDVFDALIPVNFTSDSDFLTVDGNFLKGTVISALGIDITLKNGRTTIDVFDSSWTNTGFVNATSVVPEPSTWAMGIIGFGLMGLFGYRRSLKRPAMSAA